MSRKVSWAFAAAVAASAWLAAAPGELLVYVGTYTGAKSKGVYVTRLNVATGALSAPQLAAETVNPSFLAVRPQGDYLYAVNEVDTFNGKPTGSVSAFAIDEATGALKALNQATSGGPGPAHLSLDTQGRTVLVANYGGGSIETLPIKTDGSLDVPVSFIQHTGSSVNPDRQKEPHAHQIVVDPTNHFAYVADLGLDKVMIYRFDPAKHALTAAKPWASPPLPPGSGPRHAVISANGRFVYVLGELTCTITVFGRDPANGALGSVQWISSLPPDVAWKGFSAAEIALSPSGAFLYASNRGHDSISVFAVDPSSGKLTYVANTPTGGKTPRGFGIDPTGAYLIAGNQNSDSLVIFKVDRASGRLAATGTKLDIGAPVDVKFVKP